MKKNNQYFSWGLTAVLSVCAIMLFHDVLFGNKILVVYIKKFLAIMEPVIYGAFLAYLLAPTVNWFEKILAPRMKRRGDQKIWLRAISILFTWVIVGALIFALLWVLLPELGKSVQDLINNGETYYNNVANWVQGILKSNPDFANWTEGMLSTYYNEILQWTSEQLLPKLEVAIMAVTGGVVSVLVFLKNFLIGIIVSIYLLATKERFGATSKKLCYAFLSEKNANRAVRGSMEVDRIFSGFVRGKLLDSLIIGILCFIFSMFVFKFPYAPLVSLIVGVTNVIPYFGPFLGAIPSAFLILLDSPIKCLYFCIFIFALQQFDGNILGPKILGETLGLSSFWVIVAILLGGGLFGIPGMFFGVPMFACLYSALRAYSAYRLKKNGLPADTEAYYADQPQSAQEDEIEQS